MYETKFEERRTGKIIGSIGYIVVIAVIGALGYTVIENHKSKDSALTVEKKDSITKDKKRY